jgi:hypothetical protein
MERLNFILNEINNCQDCKHFLSHADNDDPETCLKLWKTINSKGCEPGGGKIYYPVPNDCPLPKIKDIEEFKKVKEAINLIMDLYINKKSIKKETNKNKK